MKDKITMLEETIAKLKRQLESQKLLNSNLTNAFIEQKQEIETLYKVLEKWIERAEAK